MPSAPSSAGQEAIDLAASGGLHLEPHQQTVLHGALGERRDGRWAASQVVVVECRQNGKDVIAEAREAAGLYLFGEMLQTHTAHRYDTVQEHFRRVRQLCVGLSDQTGDRQRKIKKISETNGDEYIELMSGQRVIFKTRSKLSGRGFSGQVLFLNEAMYLADLGSMLPSLSAQDAPQVWWMGSAPLPRSESDPLRNVMRHGRREARARRRSGRVAYFEWSAHVDLGPQPDGSMVRLADVDITNKTYWAQANPGLGGRISVDWVEHTELATLTHEQFCAERLGLYEDLVDGGTAFDESHWTSCADPTSKTTGPLVLTFEVSLDRQWAQIGVASESTTQPGAVHVEIIENRRRTGWVIPRLLELQKANTPTAILCNPAGPAGGLLPEAEKAGLMIGLPDPDTGKVKAVSGRDYTQACQSAYDAIVEGRWCHIDQPDLNVAVGATTKRTVGDAFVFDRRGATDISPFLTVMLAAWGFGRAAASPTPEPFMVVT